MILDPRVVKLTTRTEIDIKRNIPHAYLRRIGAWVFLDHFGPTEQVEGMVVASHPHTGLQTVTWPFAGLVDHRDSIGSKQLIQPGQLNIMTAGRGIAHSELSKPGSESLHAVQLWIALPEAVRNMDPEFQYIGELPKAIIDNAELTVFIGELGGVTSTAKVFSPLVGAEVTNRGPSVIPLNPTFEHGLVIVGGQATVNGELVTKDQLIYFETGTKELNLEGDFRAVLIGGEPFPEPIVMWWNFIGRSQEEIAKMRTEWNTNHEVYGSFQDEVGGWIPAPELPNVTLRPRL